MFYVNKIYRQVTGVNQQQLDLLKESVNTSKLLYSACLNAKLNLTLFGSSNNETVKIEDKIFDSEIWSLHLNGFAQDLHAACGYRYRTFNQQCLTQGINTSKNIPYSS